MSATNGTFLLGIEQFNRAEYFEAHETWETLWLTASGEDKIFLQGAIQLAAAFHQWERGNERGTLSLLRRGREKLAGFPRIYRDIRVDRLSEQAADWIEALAGEARTPPASPPRIELEPAAPGAPGS